jgi:hypothetical protein
MKNSFGEEYGTNEYELYPLSTFSITTFGNVYKPEQKKTISGSINIDIYNDIKEVYGLQDAKDAWWEFYERIRREIKS